MQDYLSCIAKIPRESKFPVRLHGLFFCVNHRILPSLRPLQRSWFEVSLRLESSAPVCRDVVNDIDVAAPFPNIVWKMPGTLCAAGDSLPRDVISLIYPAEALVLFRQFDMVPEEKCIGFTMTQEVRKMAQRLRSLSGNAYSPGAADEMDWLAFSLIKTVLLETRRPAAEKDTPAIIVRNVAAWLKMHCCDEFDLMELISRQGISHTLFYQEWNKHFEHTPHQEIIQGRLNTAAEMLRQTALPIAEIVREVRFSGTYAFHRCFVKKFGMTPGAYRKRHAEEREI